MQTKHLGFWVACTFLLSACGDDASSDGTGSASATTDDTGSTEGDCLPSDAEIPALDQSACAPAATDYTPTIDGSAADVWPTCANDDGTYHPFEQPGAAARVEAFEAMRAIFAGGLTVADFTAAREQYALDQGLESRVLRREDVHYPEIPAADRDPAVDFDKQCSIAANVSRYPDRCAGPARIAPLINEAFVEGQSGRGDPAVHAARIDAGLAWFMFISVMKESAFSCPAADHSGDCDSGWAYYNGATGRSGGLGFGANVRAASPLANDRVFDGLAAMRCVRDTYADEEAVDPGDPFFGYAYEQLVRANDYAAAVVLRERIAEQLPLCGSEAAAHWAWVQVFGQGLLEPARQRSATEAAALATLLDTDEPTPEALEAGVAILDALFPCP